MGMSWRRMIRRGEMMMTRRVMVVSVSRMMVMIFVRIVTRMTVTKRKIGGPYLLMVTMMAGSMMIKPAADVDEDTNPNP